MIVLAALCAVCSADPKPGVVASPLAYAPYAAAYTHPLAAPLAYTAPALAAYTAPIAHSAYAVNQVHGVAAPLAVAPGHLAYTAYPYSSPYLLK